MIAEKHVAAEETIEGGWLTEAYDYNPPQRGQIREGVILEVGDYGVVIDIGLKRDGFVPPDDLDRLDEEELSALKPNQDVIARVMKPRDENGNLILSLYETRTEQDWNQARELLDSGEFTTGEIVAYNQGGLLVRFNHLEGFIPGSHLASVSGGRYSDRQDKFQEYVGQELPLKIIEVNQRKRRLIFSERLAVQELREVNTERLLNELVEGDVYRGTVSRLVDFGAFVDLGGADGLIHISEMAWQKIRHPGEVVQVGDEVDVYVLKLDHKRKRISLSLKRLQPDPWTLANDFYTVGQIVRGRAANIVDFGVFVSLDVGIQALLHLSELADPPPEHPQEMVHPGDELIVRILRIEPERQRMALSLKAVSDSEREAWLAKQTPPQKPAESAKTADPASHNETPAPAGEQVKPVNGHMPEQVDQPPAETISSAFAR